MVQIVKHADRKTKCQYVIIGEARTDTQLGELLDTYRYIYTPFVNLQATR